MQATGQTRPLGDWGSDVSLRKDLLGFPFPFMCVCATVLMSVCDSDVSCMGASAFDTPTRAQGNCLGFPCVKVLLDIPPGQR